MPRNARDPLFDLYCMAYLPASAIPLDGPRKAGDEEEHETPRPARPWRAGQLTAAVAAIITMVAVISVARLPF